MLAGTLVYVNAGTQLARIDSSPASSRPALLGSLVLLGVFPLAGAQDRRRRVQGVRSTRAFAPGRFDRNLVVIGGGSAGW